MQAKISFHASDDRKINIKVKPLYSRHHWFSKKVSARERCPLQRGEFQKKIANWFPKMVSAIERCPL